VPFASNRRWFRFSLRTLFVLVTLLAAIGSWVGRNLSAVQARRSLRASENVAFLTYDENRYGRGCPGVLEVKSHRAGDLLNVGMANNPSGRKRVSPTASPRLSAIRRWLGDKPMFAVIVFDESDFESARARFPESLIVLYETP
jgi:hypothetical protein